MLRCLPACSLHQPVRQRPYKSLMWQMLPLLSPCLCMRTKGGMERYQVNRTPLRVQDSAKRAGKIVERIQLSAQRSPIRPGEPASSPIASPAGPCHKYFKQQRAEFSKQISRTSLPSLRSTDLPCMAWACTPSPLAGSSRQRRACPLAALQYRQFCRLPQARCL